jgi:hypothetical protein
VKSLRSEKFFLKLTVRGKDSEIKQVVGRKTAIRSFKALKEKSSAGVKRDRLSSFYRFHARSSNINVD